MIALKIPKLNSMSLIEAERAVLVRALRQCGGHVESAADVLCIGVSTFYRKIVEHDIKREERR